MNKTVRIVAALLFVFTCIFCMKSASTVKAEEVKYKLWVGEVQVTSANKDNIPGIVGGKASYDPVNHVLRFSGNVTGVQKTYMYNPNFDRDALIYFKEGDLTIKGKFTPADSAVYTAIYVDDGILTIDDSDTYIDIFGKSGAFYSCGFVLNSGSVRARSDDDSVITSYGDIVINDGSLLAVIDFSNTYRSPIYLNEDFYLNGGNVAINYGEYGIYSEYGHFYLNGGSLTSDKTLYAGSGIDIDPKLIILPQGSLLSLDGTKIVDNFFKDAKNISIQSASSVTYPLWVGKHQVTAANKDNIPVSGGTASYNPVAKTLTLNNVTGVDGLKENPDKTNHPNMQCLIYSEVENLTIKGSCNINEYSSTTAIFSSKDIDFNGNFKIRTSNSNSLECISSDGSIQFSGGQSCIDTPYGDAAVFCKNDFYIVDGNIECLGKYYGIHTNGSCYFDGGYIIAHTYDSSSFANAVFADQMIIIDSKVSILYPSDGKVTSNSELNYFYKDYESNRLKYVEVGEALQNYDLYVMDTQVTNRNRFDIYDFDGGTVSYNPYSNTLFFDNVNCDSSASKSAIVQSNIQDLRITGNATIDCQNCTYGFYSYKDIIISGIFDITVDNSAIYAVKVTFESGETHFRTDFYLGICIDANSIKVIDGEHSFSSPHYAIYSFGLELEDGIKILEPSDGVFDSSQNSIVSSGSPVSEVTIGPEKYNLKVGGVQITSKNCNAIPGVYGGTASYDPVTKTLYWSNTCKLKNTSTYALIDSDDDLTISGGMVLNDNKAHYGIVCNKLTINGLIRVKADTYGVFANGDIEIKPGTYAYLIGTATNASNGTGIRTKKNIFICEEGNIRGIGRETGIYVDGSINMDSANYIDGEGDKFGIRVVNDFKIACEVEARSSGEAISVGGTVSIDPNYGIIRGSYYDKVASATHLSDDKKKFLTADDIVAKQVEINYLYLVYVGGKKITSESKDNILGLASGKGSYKPADKTLYLEDAVINDVWYSCIDSLIDLKVVTKGDCKIINTTSSIGIYITGILTVDGSLYIEMKDGQAITANDFELSDGYEILIPEGGKFDKTQETIVDKDGNPAKIVKIGKKAEATPTPGSTPTPGTTPEPGTVSPGNTIEDVEAVILALPNDDDPAGSDFATLQAKASKVTKNSIKLTWKKVAGAKSYYIYGNKCGVKNKYKRIKVVSKTTFTQKKLKKGTYYKYLIVAVDKDGKVLSTSKTIHAATLGGKVGNAKSITTKAKKNKVTLKKGKTFKLKAKQKAASKKLKVKKHRAIQYESTNPAVATVNSSGKIKAVGKGKCDIYVYAQNGITKKIKVTVK
ncbi:MAG: Ig-like domain-containing protein [Eubacterium sp.]|nr:Ig-like domain-containing protein [Eubacterium sp.]